MKTKHAMKLQWVILFLVLLAAAVPGWAIGVAPVPFISQPLYPSALALGGPAFVLTLNGAGFVAGSEVNWNGSALPTTFVSSDELRAKVPSANIAMPGTALVTVSNGGVVSNVAYFEITNRTTSVSFSNSYYAVSLKPYSVAAADFNGDGILDLAVASAESNVSVLLGNGEGTFQPAVNYYAGGSPYSVAVGDFNGDGYLDLAVANGTYVAVLLGNGDGTFQGLKTYSAGSNPVSVAVGDFNGDGILDLAVADYSGNVIVLLGKGDGTFQAAPDSPYATGTHPFSVAVGDFNGDGYLDLAIADFGGGVIVLMNNADGTGTFQVAPDSPYAAGTHPSSVAVGDFNGDGYLDLAVANYGSNNVSVLLGNGDGSFQGAVNYPAGTQPRSVAVGDLNGDGTLDLAVADYGGSTNVSVLLGNGDGTFQTALSYAADSSPWSVAVGDFNGDGRMDLAVANQNSNNVSILLQPTPSPPIVGTITGVTAGTGLSGGGGMGDVTLTNTGILSLTAGTWLSSTGGQNATLNFNTALSDARYLNPANFMPGTAGINITGTAANAGNALALAGVAASNFARLDIGNSFTGNQGVTGNVSVTGNSATTGSMTIGSGGTAITKHLSMTFNPSFPRLGTLTCATASFTFTGASDGDTIALGVPSTRMTGGGNLAYNAWVSAANTVTIQGCNNSRTTQQKTAGKGSIRVDIWEH